jgi:hypothetical protein
MYALVRILGNDLWPRHETGQTLRNLKYILENEADFDHCTKFFALNKILDSKKAHDIKKLLDSHGYEYWEDHIEWDNLDSDPMGALIGLNAVRNRAIRKYLDRKFEVVLPLDGNCFFSKQGWSKFESLAYHSPRDGYFAIPMQRCKDYSDLTKDVDIREAWHSSNSFGRPTRKLDLTEPQRLLLRSVINFMMSLSSILLLLRLTYFGN